MLWIFSALILSYAAFLALRLLRDALAERKTLKLQSQQLERRLQILEQAAQKSRYALPQPLEPQPGSQTKTVKDLDRHG